MPSLRVRVRAFVLASVAVSVCLALAVACTDQENASTPKSVDATDGGGGTSRDGGGTTAPDGATVDDSGADCVFTSKPPVADGGGRCGAMPLGDAAAFGPIDASDNDYDGGTIPPGIYDVVSAERLSANPGSWNETLVVGPGNRFSRVRQLDIGSGLGAVTERSGTFTTSGNQITFTEDCLFSNGSAADAGASTFPYEMVGTCNDSVLRYGVTGVRVTLKRR